MKRVMLGSTSFHFSIFSSRLDPATNLVRRIGEEFFALMVGAIVDITTELAKLE